MAARHEQCPSQQCRNKVRAIMFLTDQETDSISTELSSQQGIFLSSHSTNFNVHYSLAFRTSASTRGAQSLKPPNNY